jgi:hypothetical protein
VVVVVWVPVCRVTRCGLYEDGQLARKQARLGPEHKAEQRDILQQQEGTGANS